MLNAIDQFYEKLEEPLKSCFLALRNITSSYDKELEEVWKYGGSFFYYKKKPFCYFWKDKKTGEPYIGIAKGYLIEHPSLVKGNRTQIKIIPISLDEDIPKKIIYEIFDLAKPLYT